MAEGDNKETAQQSNPANQGITSQTGGNPAGLKKKRRRRRPKNRKPNPVQQAVAVESTPTAQAVATAQVVEQKDEFSLEPLAKDEAVSGISAISEPDITLEPAVTDPVLVEPELEVMPEPEVKLEPEVVSETEVVPEIEVVPELEVVTEPDLVPEPEQKDEFGLESEPVLETEPEIIPVQEPEPEVIPEPEPLPEPLPEPEPVQEPESEVVPVDAGAAAGAATGATVGWAQLKDAIKKDHVETEKKMKESAFGDGKSARNQPDLQEGEVIISSSSQAQLDDDELEKKEVIQIITRYVLGGCAVIAIISGIFFFKLPQMAFEGITGIFKGSDTQEEVKNNGVGVDTSSQTDLNEGLKSTFIAGDNKGTSRDKFEEGVETALVTGEGSQVYEGAPDAIKTLYLTGLETVKPEYLDRIGSYMGVLLKLQNAFATDIHQLLDGSTSREEALNLHLIELREAYQESLDTQRVVNEEKDRLKIQFNEATTQKDKLEKDFFAALDKLESSKSNDMLNAFIEVSKKQIELKAEYNSLNKVSKLFETALLNMDARIKDIELNRDALIQGVKVVDIKGSDLKLIIQESDLL
ncbi:hypothetical protein C0416_02605 [bacterium]|nr:hypothetical protein [bacterium]